MPAAAVREPHQPVGPVVRLARLENPLVAPVPRQRQSRLPERQLHARPEPPVGDLARSEDDVVAQLPRRPVHEPGGLHLRPLPQRKHPGLVPGKPLVADAPEHRRSGHRLVQLQPRELCLAAFLLVFFDELVYSFGIQ